MIALKRETMNFDVEDVRVIQALYSYQGSRFTEQVDDKEEIILLDQLYRPTTGKREDYINPTMDGPIR